MTTGAEVVREARSWVGTPWRHGQAAKGLGCDCIGLIGGVAHARGITDAWINGASPYQGYGRQPDPRVLLQGCDEFLDPVLAVSWRLGDILVLRFAADPQHFAFVSRLNPDYMIHNWQRRRKIGVVTENRINDWWRARVVRVYRFRGLS